MLVPKVIYHILEDGNDISATQVKEYEYEGEHITKVSKNMYHLDGSKSPQTGEVVGYNAKGLPARISSADGYNEIEITYEYYE